MENSVGDDKLADFHRMFFDADEAARDERREGNQARDYFDGKQYTAEELEVLRTRKQPPTTLNRVARKINHLAGLEVDRRTDPIAYARRADQEKPAQAATDALRYVEQNINLDQNFTRVNTDMLIEGYGGIELTVKPVHVKGRLEAEIGVEYWEWDRLFYDPHSVKSDFSDATYLGGVEWLDMADAKSRFRGKDDIFEASKTATGGVLTDDYDDTPEKKSWVTKGNRPRVRIVHMYYKLDGAWWNCQFTGGGVLTKKPVPFMDDNDESWCPLFLQSAYVDRDGDRYGEVRNLISPQDMINKTHSKLQHLMSVRQIVAEDGAISEDHGGIDGARQELARPDGVIIRNPGMEFEVSTTSDMAAGHASLLQEFKSEMDLMGPNASMQGKGPQSQSGRALIAQTEGGMREFNPVADRYSEFKERVYRAVFYLMRQFWTNEKELRVLGENQEQTHITVNRPITAMERAMTRVKEQGGDEQQAAEVQQRIMSHPVYSQLANEVVDVENNLSELDVDIILDTTPDMVTMQGEQFQQLMSLAPAAASAGQPIPLKVLIMASSLRDKDKILKEIEGSPDDPQAQAQAAQQAQEQQMLQMQAVLAELQQKLADIEKTKAETQEKIASAALKEAQTVKTATSAELEEVTVSEKLFPSLPAAQESQTTALQ